MPLKKDEKTGRRSVEMELELPGTPEQVWQAMATGPGFSAWFTKTDIEEREGGAVAFNFGEGVMSKGVVTTWQPPEVFGIEEYGWSEGAPPVATEITIEALSGGTCKVRMVHSLFTTEDTWDHELEGFEKGWPASFRVLRLYLEHYAGQPSATFRVMAEHTGTQQEAWEILTRTLHATSVAVGDAYTSPDEAPQLTGKVERCENKPDSNELAILLEKPSQGIALIGTFEWGGKVHAAISFFLYSAEGIAQAAQIEEQWHTWMKRTFPA